MVPVERVDAHTEEEVNAEKEEGLPDDGSGPGPRVRVAGRGPPLEAFHHGHRRGCPASVEALLALAAEFGKRVRECVVFNDFFELGPRGGGEKSVLLHACVGAKAKRARTKWQRSVVFRCLRNPDGAKGKRERESCGVRFPRLDGEGPYWSWVTRIESRKKMTCDGTVSGDFGAAFRQW